MGHNLSRLSLISTVAASGVEQLTSGSFEQFVTGNERVLVSFNVPWCEHCQSLVPQLEKAAASLENHGWHAASVNCEAEELLCREYQIGIYPTVYAFSGSSSNFTVYNDFHNAGAMELFARRWRRPLVSALTSADEIRDFPKTDRITVIANIDEADLQSRTAFWNVAEVYHDEFSFACLSGTSAVAAGLKEDIAESSIVLYRASDGQRAMYQDVFDAEKIEDFLIDNKLPLILEVDLDVRIGNRILSRKTPVAFLFAESKADREHLAAKLIPLATATKGQMVWAVVNPSKHIERASQLGLEPGPWPAFAIDDGGSGFQYAHSSRGSVSRLGKEIGEVVQKYFDGELSPTVKSRVDPKAQLESVMDLVGSNHNETAYRTSGDTVVLYYSPTCKHCQALMPTYQAFATMVVQLCPGSSVVVAKMDSASDAVWPAVRSVPTIRLFKAAGSDPITYQGDRAYEDLLRFLGEYSGQECARSLAARAVGHDKL
ncbi:hypothetical protein KC332_g9747 [Hortaea werneckii]|nr:hypothetical protein KC358_g10210 [Hortaea werneckii]KAI6818791.1 hypothetical protein KC342_g14376 [Hortaea werneckii]KAI6825224.1 hypothetical protein KC350_g8841 [Hortaea werneckii]KAI6920530.1 hypothetical protein KC348_g10362 [Hortaea werneckii]KAI6931825.1 hypothetical protein KC341_g9380 [Hortaea werneckii]